MSNNLWRPKILQPVASCLFINLNIINPGSVSIDNIAYYHLVSHRVPFLVAISKHTPNRCSWNEFIFSDMRELLFSSYSCAELMMREDLITSIMHVNKPIMRYFRAKTGRVTWPMGVEMDLQRIWPVLIRNMPQLSTYHAVCWSIHYSDVIMRAITSQNTFLSIVYSVVCSGVDHTKHQSSALLAFMMWIHLWPVNYPHKGPSTRKMLPFDYVIVAHFIVPLIVTDPRTSQHFWKWCYADTGPSAITMTTWLWLHVYNYVSAID